MEKILSKLILSPKVKFIETIAYPKVLTEFLEMKINIPVSDPHKEAFNIESDMLASTSSINFLTYELNVLMRI